MQCYQLSKDREGLHLERSGELSTDTKGQTVSRLHRSAQVEFLLGSFSGYTVRNREKWDRNLRKFESLAISSTIISEGKIKTLLLNTIGYFNLDAIQSCLLARSLYVHQDANESIKLFSKQQYVKQFIFPDGMSISYWELRRYRARCFVGQAQWRLPVNELLKK